MAHRLLLVVTALATLLGLVRPSAALIIDIDALVNTNANPITVLFAAGTYEVVPIGTADGGVFNAWNAWGGSVDGCDGTGEHCGQGWLNNYSLESDEWGPLLITEDIKYATPLLALAHAQPTTFTLSAAGPVRFFQQDCCYDDNIGGLSVSVTAELAPVPEPSTWLLLGSGLVGMTIIRVRSRTVRRPDIPRV